MTIRINELIATLNSAQEAQDAVPAMKAELDRLRRALEASQKEASRFQQAADDIGVELTTVKTLNTSLGSERDEAQFRALELEDKLATISKVMGSALGLVEPPKASEVKAVESQSEAVPTSASTNLTSSSGEPDAASFSYSDADHLAKSAGVPTFYSRDVEPKHTYGEYQATAPEVAAPSPSPTQEPKDWRPEDWKAENVSEGSTPTYFGHQEAPSTPPAAPSQPSPNAPTSPAPYLGVRWQDKPAAMSWSDFVDQGGERPYWM